MTTRIWLICLLSFTILAACSPPSGQKTVAQVTKDSDWQADLVENVRLQSDLDRALAGDVTQMGAAFNACYVTAKQRYTWDPASALSPCFGLEVMHTESLILSEPRDEVIGLLKRMQPRGRGVSPLAMDRRWPFFVRLAELRFGDLDAELAKQ